MERPRLQTNGLSPLSEEPLSATASPARGKEMRTNLLQKLRPPPLVHAWEFWYEKPPTASSSTKPRTTDSSAGEDTASETHYTPNLVHLHSLTNVGTFWSLFNNFDFSIVPARHTVSLFHAHTKPLWEDPRNAQGGAWTFRVPRGQAVDFWRELCLLAIGEQLQAAVDSARVTFRDDICGVAFSPRYGSVLVTVWNRDAAHESGVQRVVDTVKAAMTPLGLWPGDAKCYYKAHREHDGFSEVLKKDVVIPPDESSETSPQAGADAGASVAKMEEQVAKVRRILEGVKTQDGSGG